VDVFAWLPELLFLGLLGIGTVLAVLGDSKKR
jgi:hypothetical protein